MYFAATAKDGEAKEEGDGGAEDKKEDEDDDDEVPGRCLM